VKTLAFAVLMGIVLLNLIQAFVPKWRTWARIWAFSTPSRKCFELAKISAAVSLLFLADCFFKFFGDTLSDSLWTSVFSAVVSSVSLHKGLLMEEIEKKEQRIV
jgi:hypothetical protein